MLAADNGYEKTLAKTHHLFVSPFDFVIVGITIYAEELVVVYAHDREVVRIDKQVCSEDALLFYSLFLSGGSAHSL